MATEMASHTLCECVALVGFRRHGLDKHFLWNQAILMRFHYVRYCTLSEVWDYWQNKADGDAQ
jgi:hypothetical protein